MNKGVEMKKSCKKKLASNLTHVVVVLTRIVTVLAIMCLCVAVLPMSRVQAEEVGFFDNFDFNGDGGDEGPEDDGYRKPMGPEEDDGYREPMGPEEDDGYREPIGPEEMDAAREDEPAEEKDRMEAGSVLGEGNPVMIGVLFAIMLIAMLGAIFYLKRVKVNGSNDKF